MGFNYLQTDDRDEYFAQFEKKRKPKINNQDLRIWRFTDKHGETKLMNKKDILEKFGDPKINLCRLSNCFEQAECMGYSWEVINAVALKEKKKQNKQKTSIKNNKKYKLNDLFWFGKYAKKQTVKWIIDNDLQYFTWSNSEKCNCKTEYEKEVLEYVKNK